MALCAAGRAVALASVVAAVALQSLHVAHLALAAALDAALFVVFDLAEGAALPQIVPETLLPLAVAQNETRRAAASLVGQPAGGFFFGIDRTLPFLLDALTSALSVAAVLALRGPIQGPGAARGRRLREEVGQGLVLVWRDRFLRSASILIGVANLVFGAVPLLLLLRAQQRGATPAFVGLLFGVEAAAGVLGALPAARLRTVLGGRVVVVGVLTVWALVLLGLSLLTGLLPLVAGAALLGVLNPVFNTVLTSEVYRITPQCSVECAAPLGCWAPEAFPSARCSAAGWPQSWGPARASASSLCCFSASLQPLFAQPACRASAAPLATRTITYLIRESRADCLS